MMAVPQRRLSHASPKLFSRPPTGMRLSAPHVTKTLGAAARLASRLDRTPKHGACETGRDGASLDQRANLNDRSSATMGNAERDNNEPIQ